MAIHLDLLHHITDDELVRLSAHNPGYQFERTAEGRLLVSPTGGESGRQSMEVAGQLYVWNVRIQGGIVFDSSTGFHLPDGSCLSPDASWISRNRWQVLSPADQTGLVPLCPDAVFEVGSPSDTLAHLQAKMRQYIQNGAALGVLVDPEHHDVEVYRPGREPELHSGASEIALDPELPEFRLVLNGIWQG